MIRMIALWLFSVLAVTAMAQDGLDWKGKEIKVAPISKDGQGLWNLAVEGSININGSIALKGKVTHKDGSEGSLRVCLISRRNATLVIVDSRDKVWFYKGKLSKDLIFTGTLDKKSARIVEEQLARKQTAPKN